MSSQPPLLPFLFTPLTPFTTLFTSHRYSQECSRSIFILFILFRAWTHFYRTIRHRLLSVRISSLFVSGSIQHSHRCMVSPTMSYFVFSVAIGYSKCLHHQHHLNYFFPGHNYLELSDSYEQIDGIYSNTQRYRRATPCG